MSTDRNQATPTTTAGDTSASEGSAVGAIGDSGGSPVGTSGAIRELFREPHLRVVNIGLPAFADSLRAAGASVVDVDFRPPAFGDPELAALLDRSFDPVAMHTQVEAANRQALTRLLGARPALVGIGRALDVIPGMRPDLFLHAGPPIEWSRMCGPLRGAIAGGLLLEGMAATPEEAFALAASGRVAFAPCHQHAAVGPMAGVITASMPVFIVENQAPSASASSATSATSGTSGTSAAGGGSGNHAYSTLNEGLGKVLRFGAFGPEVLARLRWMASTLAPTLAEALDRLGPIDLRAILAQALQMGDEGHNRNRAASSLLIRTLAPQLVRGERARAEVAEVLDFLHGNDHFFLNLSMAACKAALDAADGVPGSTVLTAMSRNGTDFGIRLSGLPGRWFTAPAEPVRGLFFPGFGEADANPDLGDSAITETAGVGGFCMAAAPAIIQFVGGSAEDALATTLRMYQITLGEHPLLRLPQLGFRGAPSGIDLRLVLATGILPQINTGIAHREPGVGQVGAGLVNPPRQCFATALRAFVEQWQEPDPQRS